MTKNTKIEDKKSILERLDKEEKHVREQLATDEDDFEELQSDWQEKDDPAERNLREVEWNQYSQLQDELTEIEDARRRVNDDVYGLCEDCEGEIPEGRLKSLPTARRCISCQEQVEMESGFSGKSAKL